MGFGYRKAARKSPAANRASKAREPKISARAEGEGGREFMFEKGRKKRFARLVKFILKRGRARR